MNYENKVICGDCSSILTQIPDGVVDLTVTSPPYGDMRETKGFRINLQKIIEELLRVTAKGGVVVWVVGDETKGSESCVSFQQALRFRAAGFNVHDTMLYEKTGTSFASKGRYTQVFEFMFVFSKGTPKTFNPICDVPKLWEGSWGKTKQRQKDGSLKESGAKSCGKGKSGRATVEGQYGYKQRSNIWRIVNGKGFGHTDELAYKHHSTFPEALAHDHILSWSNPGDLVLDCMCGSGTTLKMAEKLGRRWIGIELEKEYCELAEARVALVRKL